MWRAADGFRHAATLPLRTTLSDHRLRNANVAQRIVASTGLSPPALVYEFGAGAGDLTAALVPHAGRIVAIEQDRQLWQRLRARFQSEPRVNPVLGDFRHVPRPRQRASEVVANLPFAHTSEAMRSLLSARSGPRAAHLIIERDAAMRWGGFGERRWSRCSPSPGSRFGSPSPSAGAISRPHPEPIACSSPPAADYARCSPPRTSGGMPASCGGALGQGRGSARRNLAAPSATSASDGPRGR